MKTKNACGSRERERERESRNLGKIEEREGLYSKNRPLFICTTKLTQGKSVNDNASNILKMQSIRKNNSMRSTLNAVSGITLIALVVTIVVLLILASVSITVVFGDNGILQLAKEAGEKTNEAVKNDKENIGYMTSYIKSLSWDSSKVTAVTTKDGGIVPVPKGFVGSEIDGENTIKDGFVIYEIPEGRNLDWQKDGDENREKDGILDIQQDYNQFVWIPADGVSLEYKQDQETWKDKTLQYNEYTDWTDEESEEEQKIVKREESVAKYGGFYVGRYEAGVPESKDYTSETKYQDKANQGNRNKSADQVEEKDLPASRKGLQAWNYISQINAKELSKKIYQNNDSVTSRLIDSYAWDTICTWLSNDGIDVLDSTSWGNNLSAEDYMISGLYAVFTYNNGWSNPINYSRTSENSYFEIKRGVGYELATGITERNKAKNIYDFAGNMWEMTTEEGKHKTQNDLMPTKTYKVGRGGGYLSASGNIYPASARAGDTDTTTAGYRDAGFRIVLYVKE